MCFLIKSYNEFSYQRWTSSKAGCYLSAYIMYFVGCIHVYMMSIISFERYYVLKSVKNMEKITTKLVIKIVISVILLSLFWATMPLVGW